MRHYLSTTKWGSVIREDVNSFEQLINSMTTDKKMLLIRNCDLWSNLSGEEVESLDLIHHFIEAAKGDFIYFEAFNHNKLYFIKEGCIRIGFINQQGNEVIKEIIREGELFGQFTLEKNNLNGEFAQAHKTNVSLCAFNIADFERILNLHPEIALKYTRQVGNKLRNIQNRLVNLLNKNVKSRLIDFLWQILQSEIVETKAAGVFIPNYLTHADIAHMIGSSRQTVTTLMTELKTEGIVSSNRREIYFPDPAKIRSLSEAHS